MRKLIAFSFACLLASAAWCQDKQVSLEDRRKLVSEINNILATKAFVSIVDFLDGKPKLVLTEEELASGGTETSFAKVVNKHLARYGVSHLQLWTPADVNSFTDPRIVSSGLTVRKEPTGFRVHEVAASSGAAVAGFKSWDLIVAVDAKPITASAELEGLENAQKVIQYERDGKKRSARLTYRSYEPHRAPRLKWLKPGVAFINIDTFIAAFYDRAKVDKLFEDAKDAKAIILDLRYNRGGALANVYHLLGHVLPAGTTVSRSISREIIARSGKTFTSCQEAFEALKRDPVSAIALESDAKPYGGKVVVLTSHLAGSGGDRFPGTLSDLGRATLVGDTTLGKLLTGDREDITGGFQLLYPFAEVLMPSGFRIEGVGVKPHVMLSPRDTLDDKVIIPAALKLLGNGGEHDYTPLNRRSSAVQPRRIGFTFACLANP
jgi:carboxyl-terminal processing protease